MTKLLTLTVKAKKYEVEPVFHFGGFGTPPPSLNRHLELDKLEIKDQDGTTINELKVSGSFSASKKVVDIKNIKLCFPIWDIPISWAWENKGVATEIEFTLKNLKYDEFKGFKFVSVGSLLSGGAIKEFLSLSPEDFEAEIFESKLGKTTFLTQNIELSEIYSDNVRKNFTDFRDLVQKITKAVEDKNVDRFISEVEKWSNATSPSLEYQFYNLKNITEGLKEEVKEKCQEFLKEIRDLSEWKSIGIETIAEAQVVKENGFDIIADPGLKTQIRDRKYRGFPIASTEKYESVNFGSKIISNRYTKDNIEHFRNFFTNNPSQTDPQYFRGFRPGDIWQLPDGKFVSIDHWADIQDKTGNRWEIKKLEDLPRVYYEMKTFDKQDKLTTNNLVKIILEAGDLIGKTKKEILDNLFKWTQELGYHENKHSKSIRQKFTDLFWVLDRSFVGENRENCETASNTLKTYESLPDNQWLENKIKNRYSSEIETKKNEITDRMEVLFQADIDVAANENYGSGQLNSERKKIFTTYRSQIDTLPLLAEIKELIKSLVKAEKAILEFKNLDQMTLVKKLKEEYQQGSGDKKTAYTIVNQVDNQWVDRIITELGTIKKKDPQILLAESRTRLKLKYANDAVAQAIFDNQVLDSAEALQQTEKLLIKVREAQSKKDPDASLLTLLQGYQAAETNTPKNKAWQAVNGYNQQAEVALTHLQKRNQFREEVAKTLQEAKNESELETAYNRIKNSELYKQGGKSRKVIKNLWRRKQVSFQLNQENIPAENKNFLSVALVKLIPETVKDDNGEQELTKLENSLKTFKNAPESEEKGQIYQKYKKTIDQVLNEISQEKQRYQQAKHQTDDEQNIGDNQNSSSDSRLPDWVWGLVIMGVVVVIGTVFLSSILYFYQRSKRRNSTKVLK
ncbi:MAG: hypothetical protein I3273_03875 [Candidatus Moeniiplasma glomeromycotorum]|nr:hypothetical protein [Candidatus Moeniiplasma glomeromycotorum]MCE8167683.1 hypothetical protein [Candidatus Moeniiplasma glomeromycotorum]MCE8169232.1 hypothetical protein [Candidatus Moeniiplasma glomeromycotorum]